MARLPKKVIEVANDLYSQWHLLAPPSGEALSVRALASRGGAVITAVDSSELGVAVAFPSGSEKVRVGLIIDGGVRLESPRFIPLCLSSGHGYVKRSIALSSMAASAELVRWDVKFGGYEGIEGVTTYISFVGKEADVTGVSVHIDCSFRQTEHPECIAGLGLILGAEPGRERRRWHGDSKWMPLRPAKIQELGLWGAGKDAP